MRHEYGKICDITDVKQRQEMTKGGHRHSCSACGAKSDDPTQLCAPVSAPTDDCEDF